MQADHLLSIGAELGEGPVWIGDDAWFVDIKGRTIFRHTPATKTLDRWNAPELVGWVLPSAQGGLIAGLQSGPHRFDPATGAFEAVATVDGDQPANRLNDAAMHPSGRIYFGTMDNDQTAPTGRLFVLDSDVVRDTGIAPVVITNGPAIAPAGDLLYHVDTLARRVWSHPIDADGGVGAGRPFLHFTGDEGHPDGAICDAEGGVWIAFFGGGAARRYAPDGTQTDEVRFPVSNITKVALGGPDGRTAIATTARQGLSKSRLAAQPLAGDVFTFRVTVPGIPIVPANS